MFALVNPTRAFTAVQSHVANFDLKQDLHRSWSRHQMDELFSPTPQVHKERSLLIVYFLLCQSEWSPMGLRAPAQGSSLDRRI